jgi:hypothetical protein
MPFSMIPSLLIFPIASIVLPLLFKNSDFVHRLLRPPNLQACRCRRRSAQGKAVVIYDTMRIIPKSTSVLDYANRLCNGIVENLRLSAFVC